MTSRAILLTSCGTSKSMPLFTQPVDCQNMHFECALCFSFHVEDTLLVCIRHLYIQLF